MPEFHSDRRVMITPIHVCIIDRPAKGSVERCLRGLRRDGCPDARFSIITPCVEQACIAERVSPGIEVVHMRRFGLPGAYNHAVRHAICRARKRIALIGTDVEAGGSWLARAAGIAAMDSDIAVLGGALIDAHGAETPLSAAEYRREWGILEAPRPERGEGGSARFVYCVDPGAVIVDTETIASAGFFDETLDEYGAMLDVCLRAWILGYKVVKVPSAKARLIGPDETRSSWTASCAASRAAFWTVLKNYEPATLRRIFRHLAGYHLAAPESRCRRAALAALLRLPSLALRRRTIQHRRRSGDEQVFLTVEAEFAPYSALMAGSWAVLMGESDTESLVSGWSRPVPANLPTGAAQCRIPAERARFQLRAGSGGDLAVGIEATAGEEPASARVLVDGAFIGNIHLEAREHRSVLLPMPAGPVREVLDGEICVRYGGAFPEHGCTGPLHRRGLAVRRLWCQAVEETSPLTSRRVRVLLSGYDDFNGPGMKHLYHFAEILHREGFEVLVLHPGEPKSLRLMDRLPDFDTCRIAFAGPALWRRIVREIERFSPRIVHIWTPRYIPSLVGIEAKRLAGAKLIVHYEDNEELLYELWVRAQRSRRRAKRVTDAVAVHAIHPSTFSRVNALADCFTAICEPLRDYLIKAHGKETILLYPGADLERFRPMPKDAGLVEKLRLRGRIVLMYAGTVHEANMEDFVSVLEALAVLKMGHPQLLLLHCGSILSGEMVEKTVQDLDLGAFVRFMGVVDFKHIQRYLSLADILLQPGRNNVFNEFRLPSKLPEYLAMGKPVITFSAGIGKTLTDREEVLKLYRGDGVELAGKIEELILDRALAERLGVGARRRAEAIFDWEKNARLLIALYKRVAGGAAG